MSTDDDAGICVDLEAVAETTRAQQQIATVVGDCAAALTSDDLCRWADDGPIRRSADRTAEHLRDLASRFRSCGIAVDAVADDLARAGYALSDAEEAATRAVTAWTR
ncbi:hypothetical protein [Gordonia hydrophobica]|uniref:ESX-1 secretion-associated protein n=1 Tax=Gordonia hydrophobica TaxID=40516 RepID=A0ABZ2U2A1_9ACTN|nr:hypothetical protein [Gordonia hydrophobica]MBM7366783.1 hypothetical protein [Gordonia hydrophobica]